MSDENSGEKYFSHANYTAVRIMIFSKLRLFKSIVLIPIYVSPIYYAFR